MSNLSKSDQEMHDFLTNAIEQYAVSVDYVADEPVKQYIIYLPDNHILTFTQSIVLEKQTRKPYFEYCIDMDGQEITTIYTKPDLQHVTPAEKTVINLFHACARKLITQEVQTLMNGLSGTGNTRLH